MQPTPSSQLDENIRAAILAKLIAESHIAPSDLRVGVLNGIAHLAGKVDSLENWSLAEKLASQVPGVRGVVNRIEAPGAPNPARIIHLNLEEERCISRNDKISE
jgi:osmotically-inducible protein OsmY